MEQNQEVPQLQEFMGKTIVITGASSGIGRATALAFAKKKANVVLVARRENALKDLAGECEQLGGKALIVPADVTDENAMKNVAHRAIETYGKIDVWVNDAAVTLFGRFEETPSEAFRRVMETNFFGYVNGARAVMPHFREKGRGTLINVSSVAGEVAQPYTSAYTASKSAINAFAESLRMETTDLPEVHVSTVLAASIDTPLFQHGANYTGRAVKPMAPVYKAEEVASRIVSLAEHPKREVVVGGAGRLLLAMQAFMSPLVERMMAKKVETGHFQERPAPISEGNLFKPVDQWTGISGGWRNGIQNHVAAKRVAFGLGILTVGLGVFGLAHMRNSRRRRVLGLF